MRVWKLAQQCGYRNATVYGNHTPAGDSFIHVQGVYSFDTLQDIIEKIERNLPLSNSVARTACSSCGAVRQEGAYCKAPDA